MRHARLLVFVLAIRSAAAALIPSPDGSTVHDTTLHVTWLANANLAGTAAGRFGIAGIGSNGAMNYATAVQWIAALNAQHYLGHSDWQLPASPLVDPTCGAVGPHGASFGQGCTNSGMGSLYYRSLALTFPNTAVAIPNSPAGPFSNFQPYLYWSASAPPDANDGWHTFSFNTGWQGANVDGHYMYVLPMIKGRMPGAPPPTGGGLQVGADGQTVYDPVADVTWITNADLAKTQQFGAQCTNRDGTLCITADGSMKHATALNWINGMNAAVYLGQTTWQLPPIPDNDPTCKGAYHCTGDPLGNLYYNQLGLTQGTPVVATPIVKTGPFSNIQPYLYWSCQAATGTMLCSTDGPAPNFEWSFSFGNGFQGTDLVANSLYVMVYYPDPPSGPRVRSVRHW